VDEFLKQVVLQAPQLAGLLLMLYWQQRRIDQLIAQQIKITDELLALKGIMAANGYHVPPTLPH